MSKDKKTSAQPSCFGEVRESLLNELVAYPLHMPGHKRNTAKFPYLKELGGSVDITEIEGFDNLRDPRGILQSAMRRAAELWRVKKTYFSTDGSTAAVLAAIRAATRRGDKVIVQRNSHKSVYNAIELNGLNAVFVEPAFCESLGVYGSLTPESVEQGFNSAPEASTVIITSPTYDGVISDVASIARIAHDHNAALIVDEAHGAHLSLYNGFPAGATQCGADAVVQSLHKTLPSLTQTAVLHINSNLISEEEIENALSVFCTSSPSYPLMSSMDDCVKTLAERGETLFLELKNNLDRFYERVFDMRRFITLKKAAETQNGFFALDPSRIYVSVLNSDADGITLAKTMRVNYGFETEACGIGGVTAIATVGDTAEALIRFADALISEDKTAGAGRVSLPRLPEIPQRGMSAEDARSHSNEKIAIKAALGRISAQYVWAYPPGIPIIAPGEIIGEDFIEYILSSLDKGLNLSVCKAGDCRIAVVKP